MGYGYSIQEEQDPLVSLVDRAVEGFIVSTAPGAFLADLIPARTCPGLRRVPQLNLISTVRYVPSWMPGAGWKTRAEAWTESDKTLYTELLEDARVIFFPAYEQASLAHCPV